MKINSIFDAIFIANISELMSRGQPQQDAIIRTTGKLLAKRTLSKNVRKFGNYTHASSNPVMYINVMTETILNDESIRKP